jgi:hypothetical protein
MLSFNRLIHALALLGAFVASAQAVSPHHPMTDSEKIADALRAGPAFITKDATVLDWPSGPKGEYRVLRQGASEWTCLPGIPTYEHDEPGCFDKVFMQFIKQSLAGEEPHIDRLGISYMYGGAWVPDKTGKSHASHGEFHVGPHIMIVSPHQDELQEFSHDGSDGMPYVAHLPHGTQLYLVMPFQQAHRP